MYDGAEPNNSTGIVSSSPSILTRYVRISHNDKMHALGKDIGIVEGVLQARQA